MSTPESEHTVNVVKEEAHGACQHDMKQLLFLCEPDEVDKDAVVDEAFRKLLQLVRFVNDQDRSLVVVLSFYNDPQNVSETCTAGEETGLRLSLRC